MGCFPVVPLGKGDLDGLFGRETSIYLAGINSYSLTSEIKRSLPVLPIENGLVAGRFPPVGITLP